MTKVLYVEHNDDNLYMLKTRLELLGDFQVLAAEESEKGRNMAVKEHPDVILMDLEMPDADCWEVVRRLKNDAQTGHIPILRSRHKSSSNGTQPGGLAAARAHPTAGAIAALAVAVAVLHSVETINTLTA